MTAHDLDSPPKDAADAKTPPQMNFGQTVLDDLHKADFPRSFQQDLRDVYQFYLDPEARRALDEKDKAERLLYLTGWLLRNSILKLTPTRRLLLLAGFVYFVIGFWFDAWLGLTLAFLTLLLVLMLELKDKLLAQDELAAGRAVQFALMPTETPRLAGWEMWLLTRPANEVGGDLVDYLPLGNGRLGFALGDVAGKGLGAALVMAKLQATLRALAPTHGALGDLGRHVNQIFCRDGLPNRFVSMVYLELTAGSGRVRLVNAGHLPPLIVRAETLEEPTKGSAALGLKSDACYAEQSLTLDEGDLLLVYSDGLIEARNEEGAFFGEDRLRLMLPYLRDLPVAEAGRLLLAEIDRFIGEARPHDDLSLLLLKRTEPPTPHLNGAAHLSASEREKI